MADNKISSEVKQGTFETFKDYLRKGIGLRTQTQFANETGISRGNINRLLNQDVIQRPSKKLLVTLASHMQSIDVNDLLKSCGYEPETVKTVAVAIKEALEQYFNSMLGGFYVLSKDMIDETLHKDLILPYVKTAFMWKVVKESSIPDGLNLKGDDYKILECCWDYGKFCGCTVVMLGVVSVLNRPDILCGYSLNPKDFPERYYQVCLSENIDLESSCIMKEGSLYKEYLAEKKFLGEVFSRSDSADTYRVTTFGCGFYYQTTPKGFKDFVIANARYFCVNRENQQLYHKLIMTNDDPDEIFKDFHGKECWLESGTGVVVADILTNKTGHEFLFFAKDEKLDASEPDDSCVLCPSKTNYADDELFDKDVLKAVYDAAVILGIKNFGMTYVTEVRSKSKNQEYNTDSFHYCFKDVKDTTITDKLELQQLMQDADHVSDYYFAVNNYEKGVKAGKISRMAKHALENLNDTPPTEEMAVFIAGELEKIK